MDALRLPISIDIHPCEGGAGASGGDPVVGVRRHRLRSRRGPPEGRRRGGGTTAGGGGAARRWRGRPVGTGATGTDGGVGAGAGGLGLGARASAGTSASACASVSAGSADNRHQRCGRFATATPISIYQKIPTDFGFG